MQPAPLAIDNDDQIFVRLECSGIHPLVIGCDGLSLIFFGNDREHAYLKAEEVIAWHEKELTESRGQSGNRDVMNAIRRGVQQIKDGTAIINEEN